ncbi:MAG TPA: CCA tRNA nucleotidyltransferase, partial [Verrucomicrobiae bacterium]|nr:CCA tRNA nucleotidyltransferase [Verrucomicrobiae bacterium]
MKIKLNQSNKLIQAGVKIIKAIESSGFKAFFVGGSVRDLILKRELDNVDIATEAKPSEVEAVLNKEGLRTKGVGKKFGTILTISENQPIEITTFRSEGRYSDKRHPDEVTFVKDYQIDAKRRDFTINAMYLNVDSEEVLDIVNGLKDLDQQL